MSAIDRERIKRAMGIGEYPGENDLNRAWSVTTYVHIQGVKHPVVMLGNLYLIRIAPGQNACGKTLDEARENAAELLAACL